MTSANDGGGSSTNTVLIVLGVVGLGFLMCCGLIVVCLVAITALGTAASKTFDTVGPPIQTAPR